MMPYLTINYSWASLCQITHYLQYTDFIDSGQNCETDEEALLYLRFGVYPLVFLCLTHPDELINEEIGILLRSQKCVIATSTYPPHLFTNLPFEPFDFLTEPISFSQFAACLNRIARRI